MLRTLVVCSFLTPFLAFSQNVTGVISGTVTDSTQAVVPNAAVTIVNADKGVTVWRGVTNASGVYRAPDLAIGRYDVSVAMPGFKHATVSGIHLDVDQRAAVNITLQPGVVTEQVEVQGESAGQLATDSSSISNVITTSQVQTLPLPNRNILNLLSLTPGVSSGGDATGINASQLSVNGSRTLNSEFEVDGVSVVSGSTGGVQTLPSVDAISEMKVLTSSYSAEYGRTSGATVALVTASGTSQYHGGVYEYFQNNDLDANNYFYNLRGQPRPTERYNLFGAKLGGPVWIPKLYRGKQRTFFFFDYEGLRQAAPFDNIRSVPDAAFRGGDFSSSPVPVYAPGTSTPFPNNTIPASLINSAAAKILSVLPGADSPGVLDTINGRFTNNLVEAGSSHPSSNSETARIDENLTAKDRLYGTFTHFASASPLQPSVPGPLENSVGPGTTTVFQTTVDLTHTFSPTLVMEARMGFWRNNSEIVPPSLGLDVPQVLGIQTVVGPAAPTFNINGWSQYGLNSNTLRSQIDNNYQPSFSVSKVWSNHLVKFGLDLRKDEFNIYNPGGTGNSGWFTGNYTFTGEITSGTHTGGNPVNALADFLLGKVKTSGYALPQPPSGRRNYNIGAYVQDDWKLNRRLTLNLGMRYEFESPMTSSNNIYSRVDPTTGQVLFAGINSDAALGLTPGYRNFAPRVGLAYSVTPKTVIRSGFGIFYSQIFSDLGAQVLFPGYTISQAFSNLGTGVAQPFALSQGMPLIAVQNLQHPQSTLSQFTATNPLSASASFSSITPLPYAAEWNFGIQHELPHAVILDANYVGSSGNHLPLNLPNNLYPFGEITQVALVNTTAFAQSLRPYPNTGQFSAVTMAGHSTYHAIQLSARRQYGENLAFVANYTFSKSIDDGDGLFSFSQPEGLNAGQFPSLYRNLDRGLSEFDRTNELTAAIQYHTRGNRWIRNWDIDPILTARTGLPTTIYQNNTASIASQLRPDVISAASIDLPQMVPNGTGIQELIPVTSAGFPLAPVGPLFSGTGANRNEVLPAGIGTLGRDTLRTPGELDLDLGVDRVFTLRESLKLEVRGEAFNCLNHTNFGAPVANLTATVNPKTDQAYFNSPNFGLITAARAARFLQLVVRLTF
jgi:hypothetical protein